MEKMREAVKIHATNSYWPEFEIRVLGVVSMISRITALRLLAQNHILFLIIDAHFETEVSAQVVIIPVTKPSIKRTWRVPIVKPEEGVLPLPLICLIQGWTKLLNPKI